METSGTLSESSQQDIGHEHEDLSWPRLANDNNATLIHRRGSMETTGKEKAAERAKGKGRERSSGNSGGQHVREMPELLTSCGYWAALAGALLASVAALVALVDAAKAQGPYAPPPSPPWHHECHGYLSFVACCTWH